MGQVTTASPGWRAMRVQRVHDPARADDLAIPAADVQRLVLLEQGSKRIGSRSSGRWLHADHGPGSVSLTAPGRPTHLRWRSTGDQPLVTMHVEIPGSTVRTTSAQLWGDGRGPDLDSLHLRDHALGGLLAGLDDARRGGAGELYAEAAAQFLAVHLLTQHARPPAESAHAPDRVARIQDYVRAHLAEPLTLADLAAVAGLSPWHFLRVFRAATDRTPMRWVAELRLSTARRLLGATSRSVTQIAHDCGYASPQHMSAAFSRHLGTTPSRYRRQTRA